MAAAYCTFSGHRFPSCGWGSIRISQCSAPAEASEDLPPPRRRRRIPTFDPLLSSAPSLPLFQRTSVNSSLLVTSKPLPALSPWPVTRSLLPAARAVDEPTAPLPSPSPSTSPLYPLHPSSVSASPPSEHTPHPSPTDIIMDGSATVAKEAVAVNVVDPRFSLGLHVAAAGLTALSFCNGSLFGYHPTLMALSFLLFMPEAILKAVRGVGKLRKSSLAQHMLLNAASGLLGLAGLAVIYLNKERLGKAHLTSLHSRLGAIAFLLSSLIATGGIPLLYGFPAFLRKTRLPKTVSQAHKKVGTLSLFLGLAACVLGLQTFNPAHPLHKGPLTYFLATLTALSAALVAAEIQKKNARKVPRQL